MIDTTSVVVGPGQHGVVLHALTVARATGAGVVRRDDVATCRADPPSGSAVYHWHFTDRLFGATVDDAAGAFRAATAAIGGRHVVTLHDVPPADGDERDRRRAAAYRRVVGGCHAVVVASEHERRRLAAADIVPDADVIPLPVVPLAPTQACRAADDRIGRTVGILGFIHPGKGHADVIAAAAQLPADVRLVALGRASDGHDDLVATLERSASQANRELHVTGFLDDADLAAAIGAVDVPIVPAGEVSASASIGTWIAAGRRPLVVANDYAREVAATAPGLVTLYEPARIGAVISAALAHPASTRRTVAVPARLGIAAVAAAHVALYRRVQQ